MTSTHLQPRGRRRLIVSMTLALALALALASTALAVQPGSGGTLSPVNLGKAGTFVVLSKSGITNVPTSRITGDMGVSPISYTAITGFALSPIVPVATTVYSTSAQVTGKIYAANYASPTPANLTTAVLNMEAAYSDAAGRKNPNFTELYAGDISSKTLVPGLYKWGTSVIANKNVTLAGSSTSVWIFQISGNLNVASGVQFTLTGGAQARNIFWQVAGGAGVNLGTTSHVEGTILARTGIQMFTGASLNGRALAQTAVTLQKNVLTITP